jgi:hypothetical protein
VQLQATPALQTPSALETPAPPVNLSGGDAVVGYDFIEGADVPTWRIWFEGELIIIAVGPDDAGVVALLDAFRNEAEKRGAAAVSRAKADSTIWLSAGAAVFGGASAVGGTIVAVPSCATVPLTF